MNTKQKQKMIKMQLGIKQKVQSNKALSYDKIKLKNWFFCELTDIMNDWNYYDISEAVSYILKIKSNNFDLFKDALFPETYEDLFQGLLLDVKYNNLERELCWYAIIISCCKDKINYYIKLKESYENSLINGDYVNAEKFLDEIDNKIGLSFWGLDNRFILNEYKGGLEGNKEFLAKINSTDCHSWVTLLADFFSFKAEKGVNNRQYVHRIEKILENADEELQPFFVEKLFPLYKLEIHNIYYALYFNSAASVIDLYNTYIKACTRVIVDNEVISGDLLGAAVFKSLTLIENVDDIVIYKLKIADPDSTESIMFSTFDNDMLIIGDMYTLGEYERVIDITENLLNSKANCFELYEYYVKSHVMLGKKIKYDNETIIKDEIISSLYLAYVKDQSFHKSYLSVSKFARLFSNSYLGTEFSNFFVDKYMIGLSDILIKGKELFSSFINIKLINALADKRDTLVLAFEDHFGNNSVINLYKFVYLKGDEQDIRHIDSNRLRWYKIKRDILNDEPTTYKDLYEWYNDIKDQTGVFQTYQKERISTELYYIYIDNDMFLEAEELMVNAKINNIYSTLRMDLDSLFTLKHKDSKEIKKSICTPIATYLYNKNDYSAIYSSVANFLDYNGVSKPSDLFAIDIQYDKKQLIYFLRYVCISEILDSMYNVFEIDEEVESERIEICRYLQTNDIENANDYIEEISQMMQKQKILQGIKYLEDVKIDIDLNKVVEVHHDVFSDNYKRFQHIGELDIEYAAFDVTSNKIYINYEDGKKYSHKLIVFKEMLFDYRQELAFEKYGLDQTLGTRIRHGSLQNQIRIAFEKNNIALVRKSTEEGSYLLSRDFDNYCDEMDGESKAKLFEYLSEFSKDVDCYIDILNAEYIRIKTEDRNPNGLFDFSVKLNVLVYLFQNVQKLQNENLVLELFESYWLEKIELGIENARSFFENQVKQQFISMLNKLEENLNTILSINKMQYNLFDSISRSRTEVQKAIDVIIDWFKLPRKQEYSNYDAQILVDTCEMINMRVFTNYESVTLIKNIDVKHKFLGRTFSYIVDIMVILFTNAYYHSGFIDNTSKLEVTLEIIEDDQDYITIIMKNNLADSVNKYDLSNTIQDVKIKLDECIKKREYYNYEGKSGYIKICKILDYNLSCRSYLELGMDEDEKYYLTTIKIGKYSIVERGDS